jgi:hypothetical protein
VSNQDEMAARLKELDRRAKRIAALKAENERLTAALLLSAVTMERVAASLQVQPHYQLRTLIAGKDLALVAAKARAVLAQEGE